MCYAYGNVKFFAREFLKAANTAGNSQSASSVQESVDRPTRLLQFAKEFLIEPSKVP